MKKTLLLILASCLLVACMEKEVSYEPSQIIEISAAIEDPEELADPETRAHFNPDGTGHFEEKDQISLLILSDQTNFKQYQLTLDQAQWKPSISWEEVNGQAADFVSFFPSQQCSTLDEFSFKLAADQRLDGKYEQSDLMIARTSVKKGEKVALNFKHVMSKVAVVLKTDGSYTAEELAGAQVSMKAYQQVKIRPATGTVGAVEGQAVPVQFENLGGGKFQAVVCPQEVHPDWKDAWFDIAIDGRHLHNKVPAELVQGIPFTRLESGKQITISLTLRKKKPEIDWRNRTAWVYGLKNMPSLDQWGYYNTTPFKVIGLTWKPEYGWYDCNKIDPTGPGYDDNNMCWAATCSNMIHWWMDQNAENIARYGKYDGPRVYSPDSYHSEIFKFYKDHFTNEGSFIQQGLKWFFTGQYQTSADSAVPVKKHDGFFKEVLTKVDMDAASSYGLTETLKWALTNKKAIGLEILLKAGTGAHALTVWGAGFDEKGEVDVLYIAENNDRFQQDQVTGPMQPGKLCSAGLYAHKVQKQADGSYRMESSTQGQFTIVVQTLIFLGTNDADWEAYSKAHPEK